MRAGITLRRACERDAADLRALLADAGLPVLGSDQRLADMVVAELGGHVVGVMALEVLARTGLVRSVAVSEAERRCGIGRELFRSLQSRAFELSLRDLYLLTENATAFFAALGFEEIPRDEAPAEIRATREFRELCPEPARLMRLSL